MTISFKRLLAATLIGFTLMPGLAHAESLAQLEKQGYKVSKLTKNKAGLHGWVASNGDKRFFCRMNVSIAVVSKKELVSITSAGNLVKLNRATFEATLGGPDPSLPLWSDLQAGRVKAPHVKGCTPLR
ncbi:MULTISPECIES: hypothetical protein [Ensifer]|jgi:hypothetical protein|uniref:Uncharacterized protein n=1 Tax=Ensifer canadensis TaxID=555315 RepID=A0AAW4FJ46_9HYPH|nr:MULTISPECIES: hypothetical protein [Ensifer]MDP9634166.1 hypothetical protein [Ensifer adhaerens]KQU74286.1 hypothetical protein ASD00_37910 [Ensifer sp. Root31]KQW58563.1 hypothetical protein ASD02_06065 [Ensifer sp. Root1252]KQW62522.1 hypothetical protein ASD03_14170 [Ensifer sp. Root127]KQY78538.1 hypothetical protein ASD52_01365 [Ensifer sp. Root142]